MNICVERQARFPCTCATKSKHGASLGCRDQRPLVSKTLYQTCKPSVTRSFRSPRGRLSATQDWPSANSYSTDATYTRQRNNNSDNQLDLNAKLTSLNSRSALLLGQGYLPPPRDVICMSQRLDENKALKRNLLDEWFLHKRHPSRVSNAG